MTDLSDDGLKKLVNEFWELNETSWNDVYQFAKQIRDRKLNWPTQEELFENFKREWNDYPSQDNEGFLPDRGGFKCGWFSAVRYLKSYLERRNGCR